MLVPGLTFFKHQLRVYINLLGLALSVRAGLLHVSRSYLRLFIFVNFSKHDVCQALLVLFAFIDLGHTLSLFHDAFASSIDFAEETFSASKCAHPLHLSDLPLLIFFEFLGPLAF